MAYGAFNTGSGASTYDLDLLAAGVINGCVNAPLTTTDEVVIATRNGKQIVAYTARPQEKSDYDLVVANVVAGLVRMLERFRTEALVERRTLAADVIRGIVSAPLMTADENQICLSGGEPLLAYQVDEDEKSYTDQAIAKAVVELMTTGDWYQAQNLAAMQVLDAERLNLAADVIRGTISSVPIMTRSGEQICLSNGKALLAYQLKEDEKSYTDKMVEKAVAELLSVLEWCQAQNAEATHKEVLAEKYALVADMVCGSISAPLVTRSGNQICLSSGELLIAYQLKEDEKSYTEKAIAKAVKEILTTVDWHLARLEENEKAYTDRAVARLSAVVEQYQAQNVATMQTLETERQILAADIMRGTVSAPLLTKSGVQICLTNGEQLFAYQVREDEKSYADMLVMKNIAELSATVERYQAQNLAVMQSLVTGLMSGQLAVPMANNEGTAVITPSGVNITAVKNL